MKILKFEDSFVRQKSQILATEVRNIIKLNKDYSFKDQLLRASVSVSNNIAEGFERKTNKELKQFLFIAK
jgi:four helix bundle protein